MADVAESRVSKAMKREAPPGFEPGMADLQSADQKVQEPTQEEVASQSATRLSHSLSCKAETDPELIRVANAWPTLPEAMRAGILAMIEAASVERIERCMTHDKTDKRVRSK